MSAKKSFTDNPALQFISTVQEQENQAEQTQSQPITQPETDLQTTQPIAPPQTQTDQPQFQSQPVNPEAASVPMKPNPLYIETKSKRVQLLMQPSLYQKLKDRATREKMSVNELVHSLLSDVVDQ